mmetsp:Transcript_37359/g.99320  ORF Transcript_37359/g.99320 Transcript_37359/m.99320 type:complete len:88 (+) Transcript_37359:39-302(+)
MDTCQHQGSGTDGDGRHKDLKGEVRRGLTQTNILLLIHPGSGSACGQGSETEDLGHNSLPSAYLRLNEERAGPGFTLCAREPQAGQR